MKPTYYLFYLEIALTKEDDSHIYAFENVSHIPTDKLIEIFEIDIKNDPFLVEGYFLTKTKFNKHKKYLQENIGQFNFDIFEYTLRKYGCEGYQEIRKLYKENLIE